MAARQLGRVPAAAGPDPRGMARDHYGAPAARRGRRRRPARHRAALAPARPCPASSAPLPRAGRRPAWPLVTPPPSRQGPPPARLHATHRPFLFLEPAMPFPARTTATMLTALAARVACTPCPLPPPAHPPPAPAHTTPSPTASG